MALREYFECHKGYGVLATANSKGEPSAAVYSAPAEVRENEVSFLMWEKQTYEHLKENNKACYLFFEGGKLAGGTRLFLEKIAEETDTEKVLGLKKAHYPEAKMDGERVLHLVTFKVTGQVPLVGSGE